VKEEISIDTVCTCHKIGHATQVGKGVTSPLVDAENALVHICIQIGKIRQPLNCTEAIQLMNNLIEGTNTLKALIEFKPRWNFSEERWACRRAKASCREWGSTANNGINNGYQIS
jgi:hypothetical protein